MTMPNDFPYDVFLSHSAKDKAVMLPFDSLSASAGERARVRCRYGIRALFHAIFDIPVWHF